jgi:hypothetical protein
MTSDRRALLRATVVLYVYRLLASAIVAYPAARVVASFGPTKHPDGDRILFVAGGLHLYELLRLGKSAIAAAVEASAAVFGLLAAVALVPLGAALAILLDGDARFGNATRRSVELFPTFVALAGLTLFVQGAFSVGGIGGAHLLSDALDAMPDERLHDLLVVAALLPVGAAIVGVGILEDFARAAAAVRKGRALEAARDGLRALLSNPLGILGTYVGLVAVGAATVALAALATAACDVSRPGALRVAGVFLVHQAALFILSGLRVVWFRSGLSRLERFLGPSSDGLPVNLYVAAGGAIPAEIEAHDAPPE